MCCVMPPASPAATRRGADVVQQRGLAVVDVAHDGDHRRARQLLVLAARPRPLRGRLPDRPAWRRSALWPISSTRIIAVSWSSCWLMVTIWPSFISCLMTSEALTDILCARSATVMVSGTCTSCTVCFGRRDEARHARRRCGRRGGRRAARASPARAPPAAPSVRVLSAALLGGVVGPARRQLLGLDGLLVARLGDAPRWCPARPARRPSCGSCP